MVWQMSSGGCQRNGAGPLALALTIVVAGCGNGNTIIELTILDPAMVPLDRLQVRIADRTTSLDVNEQLTFLLPERLAGAPTEIEVWGLVEARQRAHGAVITIPERGATTRAVVSLTAVDCGPWCEQDDTRCESDAVIRCTTSPSGCREWGAGVPCATPTPYCSNGACSDMCVDECTAGDRRCDGEQATRSCGQGDADTCLDWLASTACGPNDHCVDGACVREPCVDASCTVADPPVCASPRMLRTFSAPGTCSVDGCDYPATETACAEGCGAGRCRRAEAIRAGSSPAQDIYVNLSTGTSFADAVQWSSFGYASHFADVNGDGKADAIRAGSTPTQDIYVNLSTGTSFADAVQWSSFGYASHFADVDGDGKADAIRAGRTPTQDIYVNLSTGTSFADAVQWSSFGYASHFADVDGQ